MLLVSHIKFIQNELKHHKIVQGFTRLYWLFHVTLANLKQHKKKTIDQSQNDTSFSTPEAPGENMCSYCTYCYLCGKEFNISQFSSHECQPPTFDIPYDNNCSSPKSAVPENEEATTEIVEIKEEDIESGNSVETDEGTATTNSCQILTQSLAVIPNQNTASPQDIINQPSQSCFIEPLAALVADEEPSDSVIEDDDHVDKVIDENIQKDNDLTDKQIRSVKSNLAQRPITKDIVKKKTNENTDLVQAVPSDLMKDTNFSNSLESNKPEVAQVPRIVLDQSTESNLDNLTAIGYIRELARRPISQEIVKQHTQRSASTSVSNQISDSVQDEPSDIMNDTNFSNSLESNKPNVAQMPRTIGSTALIQSAESSQASTTQTDNNKQPHHTSTMSKISSRKNIVNDSSISKAVGNLDISVIQSTSSSRKVDLLDATFCEFCGRQMLNLEDLKFHLQTVHGKNHFMCYVCGEIFNNTCDLMFHHKTKHYTTDALKAELNFLNITTAKSHFKYFCSQCGQDFNLIHQLLEHKKKLIKLGRHFLEDGFRAVEDDLENQQIINGKASNKENTKSITESTSETEKNKSQCDTNVLKLNTQIISSNSSMNASASTNSSKEPTCLQGKEIHVVLSNIKYGIHDKGNFRNTLELESNLVTKTCDYQNTEHHKDVDKSTQDVGMPKNSSKNKNKSLKNIDRSSRCQNAANEIHVKRLSTNKRETPYTPPSGKDKRQENNGCSKDTTEIDANMQEFQIKPLYVMLKKEKMENMIRTTTCISHKVRQDDIKATKTSKHEQETKSDKFNDVTKKQEARQTKDKTKEKTDKHLENSSTKFAVSKTSDKVKKVLDPIKTDVPKRIIKECDIFSLSSNIPYQPKKVRRPLVTKPNGANKLKDNSNIPPETNRECDILGVNSNMPTQQNKDLNQIAVKENVQVINEIKKVEQENRRRLSLEQYKQTRNLASNPPCVSGTPLIVTRSQISDAAMQIINEVSQQIEIYNTMQCINLDVPQFSDESESESSQETSSMIFCEACGSQCENPDHLREHMTSIHPGFNFVCFVCDCRFNTLDAVISHQKKHTQTVITIAEKQFLRRRKCMPNMAHPYYCNHCGKGFTLINLVAIHKKEHCEHTQTMRKKLKVKKTARKDQNKNNQEDPPTINNVSAIEDKTNFSIPQESPENEQLQILPNNDINNEVDKSATNSSNTAGTSHESSSTPYFPRFCEFCGRKHMSFADQQRDLHLEKFKCIICHSPYETIDLLVLHYDLCHPKHEVANFEYAQRSIQKKYCYYCKFCGKGFYFIGELLGHSECDHFDLLQQEKVDRSSNEEIKLSNNATENVNNTVSEDIGDDPNTSHNSTNKVLTDKTMANTIVAERSVSDTHKELNDLTLILTKNSGSDLQCTNVQKSSNENKETSDINNQDDRFDTHNYVDLTIGASKNDNLLNIIELSDTSDTCDSSDSNTSGSSDSSDTSDTESHSGSLVIDLENDFQEELEQSGLSNFVDVEEFIKDKEIKKKQENNIEKSSQVVDTTNMFSSLRTGDWDEVTKQVADELSAMATENLLADSQSERVSEQSDDTMSLMVEENCLSHKEKLAEPVFVLEPLMVKENLLENCHENVVEILTSTPVSPKKVETPKFCEACGQQFPNEELAKQHFVSNHGRFTCSVCDLEFKFLTELIKHQEVTHKLATLEYAENYFLKCLLSKGLPEHCRYYCNLCGEAFNLIYELKAHKDTSCPVNPNIIQHSSSINKVNYNIKTGRGRNLSNNITIDTRNNVTIDTSNKITIDTSNKIAIDTNTLEDKAYEPQQNNTPLTDTKNLSTCSSCGQRFVYLHLLNNHRLLGCTVQKSQGNEKSASRLHRNKTLSECKIASSTSTNTKSLKICNGCGHTFSRWHLLNEHRVLGCNVQKSQGNEIIKAQTETKSLDCQIIEDANKTLAEVGKNVSQENKPGIKTHFYRCCDKAFVYSNELLEHKLKDCPKYKAILKPTEVVDTGRIAPNKGKDSFSSHLPIPKGLPVAFGKSSSSKENVKGQSKPKPFRCSVCPDRFFVCEDALNQHSVNSQKHIRIVNKQLTSSNRKSSVAESLKLPITYLISDSDSPARSPSPSFSSSVLHREEKRPESCKFRKRSRSPPKSRPRSQLSDLRRKSIEREVELKESQAKKKSNKRKRSEADDNENKKRQKKDDCKTNRETPKGSELPSSLRLWERKRRQRRNKRKQDHVEERNKNLGIGKKKNDDVDNLDGIYTLQELEKICPGVSKEIYFRYKIQNNEPQSEIINKYSCCKCNSGYDSLLSLTQHIVKKCVITTPPKKKLGMEENQQKRKVMCENNSETPRIEVIQQEEKPEISEEKIKETSLYETRKANKINNNDNINEYDELKISENIPHANKIKFREKPGKKIEAEKIGSITAETENENHPLDHAKDNSNKITKQLDIDGDNKQFVVNDIQINITKKGQQVLNVVNEKIIDNSQTKCIIPSSNQCSSQIDYKVSESPHCTKQKLCIFCTKSFSFNFQLKKHKSESCKPFLILKKRYKRNFFCKNICEKCGLKFRNPITLSTHRSVCCKFSKMEKKNISRELRSNMDNEKKYRNKKIHVKKIKNVQQVCPVGSRNRKSVKKSGNINTENRKIGLKPQKTDLNTKCGLSHISSNTINAETKKADKSHLTDNTKKLKNQSTTARENLNLSGNKLNYGTTSTVENGTNCKNKSTRTSTPNKLSKISPVNNSQKHCDKIIHISNSSSNPKFDLSGTRSYLIKSHIEQVSPKKSIKIATTNPDIKRISDNTCDLKSSMTDKALKTNSVEVKKIIDGKTNYLSDKNTEQKLNVCNKKINQNQKTTEPGIDYYLRHRICDICCFRFDNIDALTRHKSLYCKRFNIQTKPVSNLCSGSGSKLPSYNLCQKNVTGNLSLISHNSGCNKETTGSPKLSKKVGKNQLTSLETKGNKDSCSGETKTLETTIPKLECQSKVSSNKVNGNYSSENNNNNKNQMLQTKEKEISQICGNKSKDTIKVPKNSKKVAISGLMGKNTEKISKSGRVTNTVCKYCKTNFRCTVDLVYHQNNFCKKNIPEIKHIETKIVPVKKKEIEEKNKVEESKCSKVNVEIKKSNELHTEVTKAKSINISEQADTPVLQNAAYRQDKEKPKEAVDQIKQLSQDTTSQSVLNLDGKICYRCGSEFYYTFALRKHQSLYCRIFNMSKKITENIKTNEKGHMDKGEQQNIKKNNSNPGEKLESVVNANKEFSLKTDFKKLDVHVQPFISTEDQSDNNKTQKNTTYSSKVVTDNDKKSISNKSLSGDMPHNISADANTKLMLTTATIETPKNLDIQQKTSEKNNKTELNREKSASKAPGYLINDSGTATKSKNSTEKIQGILEDIEYSATFKHLDKINIKQRTSATSNKSDAHVDDSITGNKCTNTSEKQQDTLTERNIKLVVKTENIEKTVKSPDKYFDKHQKTSDRKTKIDMNKTVVIKSDTSVDVSKTGNKSANASEKRQDPSTAADIKLKVRTENIENTIKSPDMHLGEINIHQNTSERKKEIDTNKKVVCKSGESVVLINNEKMSPLMSEKKTGQLKNPNVDIAKAYKEISSIVTEKIEYKEESFKRNDEKRDNVKLISGNNEIRKDSREDHTIICRSAKTSKNISKNADDTKIKEDNLTFSGASPIEQKLSTRNYNVCTKLTQRYITSGEKEKYAIFKTVSETTNEEIEKNTSRETFSAITILTNTPPVKNINFRQPLPHITTDISDKTSDSQKNLDISKDLFKAASLVMLKNKITAKERNNSDSENIKEIQKKVDTTEDKDAFNNEISGTEDEVKRTAKQTITAPRPDHAEDNNICTVCGYQFEYSFALKRHTSLYCKAFNTSNSKSSNKDLDINNSKTKLNKTASSSKEANKIKTTVNSKQEEDSQDDLHKHCLEKDEDPNKATNAEVIVLGSPKDYEEIEIESEEDKHLQHRIVFDLRDKLNKKSDLREKIKTKKKENESDLITKEKLHYKVPDTILNEGGLSQKISASMVINTKEKISSKHGIFDLTGTKKNSALPENFASTCPSTIVKSELKAKTKKTAKCDKSPAKPMSAINKDRIEKGIKVPSPTINPTATRVYNKVATFDAVKEQNKNKIFCEKCGQTIHSINDLENPPCGHRKNFFECIVCETDFPNINSLIYHQDQKHQATEIVIKEAEDKKNYLNRYHCCHCGEGFKLLTHIISHKANKHQFYKKSNTNSSAPIIKPEEQEEKVYICVFCNDKPFTCLEKLLRHEETSKDHKQNERKFPNFNANYSPILTKKIEHVCYICNIGFRSFKKHQIHMLSSNQHYELEKKNCSSENIKHSPSVKIVGLEINLEPQKTITKQQFNISYCPQVIEHAPSTSYYPLQTPLPSHAYSTVYPVENLPSHYFAPNQTAHFYDEQCHKQYLYQNQEQSYSPSRLYQPRPLEKPSEYTRSRGHSSDDYYSKSIPIHIPSVVNKNPLSKPIKNYSTPVAIEKSDLYKKIVGALNPDLQIASTIKTNIEHSKSISKTSQLAAISKEITKPAVKSTSSPKQTSMSNPIYAVKEVSSKNLTSASNPDYKVAYTVSPKPVTTSEPILASDDPLELEKPFIRYYDIQKHAVLSYNEFETKKRRKPEENKKGSDNGQQIDVLDIYSETSVSSDSKVQCKGHKCYGCDETFTELIELDNHECSGPF